MTTNMRVQHAPAWVLHHRPFRDTSRILDILSRDHGRLSLVARGSRSAKSRLRGILRPFTPLSLSWVSRSDLGTLTGAELAGSSLALSGDALLSAYYVNELLLKLLHKHDPQPGIFTIYSEAITKLATGDHVVLSLRLFEIELLRMLGYALNLQHDAESQQQLVADRRYEYRPERGPVPVGDSRGPMVFSGAALLAIGAENFAQKEVLRDAGRLLREVIAFHLDGKELQSRKVLLELRQSGKKVIVTED
jgi:DNA repair protein RecO (recombination protein O)